LSKKQKKKKKHPVTLTEAPRESSSAEAWTVFWIFSCLATLLSELVALLMVNQFLHKKTLLPHLFLFISLVTGVLTLSTLPVVLCKRNQPPPRPIVIFSIVVCVPPILFFVIAFLNALPDILGNA